MFKGIFSKAIIYLIVLVFIVPVIVLFLFGNLSKKQVNNSPSPVPYSSSISQNVPLPSKEDVVRTFCSLIDEGRITEAVSMMDAGDDEVRQSWGVYLNNFSSFKLMNIKKSVIDETGNSFEVDIDVKLKKNLMDLPIPNYGWENGVNKRWIGLIEKENGLYKISEIATGP